MPNDIPNDDTINNTNTANDMSTDAYYGEDELDEELDLSFLDEKDEEDNKGGESDENDNSKGENKGKAQAGDNKSS